MHEEEQKALKKLIEVLCNASNFTEVAHICQQTAKVHFKRVVDNHSHPTYKYDTALSVAMAAKFTAATLLEKPVQEIVELGMK